MEHHKKHPRVCLASQRKGEGIPPLLFTLILIVMLFIPRAISAAANGPTSAGLKISVPVSLCSGSMSVADLLKRLQEQEISVAAEEAALAKRLAICVKDRPASEVMQAVGGALNAVWEHRQGRYHLRLSFYPDEAEAAVVFFRNIARTATEEIPVAAEIAREMGTVLQRVFTPETHVAQVFLAFFQSLEPEQLRALTADGGLSSERLEVAQLRAAREALLQASIVPELRTLVRRFGWGIRLPPDDASTKVVGWWVQPSVILDDRWLVSNVRVSPLGKHLSPRLARRGTIPLPKGAGIMLWGPQSSTEEAFSRLLSTIERIARERNVLHEPARSPRQPGEVIAHPDTQSLARFESLSPVPLHDTSRDRDGSTSIPLGTLARILAGATGKGIVMAMASTEAEIRFGGEEQTVPQLLLQTATQVPGYWYEWEDYLYFEPILNPDDVD